MFTGIVQGMGRVVSAQPTAGVVRLVVEVPSTDNLTPGASIAINGVCLTAVSWQGRQVDFDVIAESMRVTNLGDLQPGDAVNVERAARFGDEIGGHLLSGHIHGTARLAAVEPQGDNLALTFDTPAELKHYLLPKGYAALNGCSLTLGPVVGDQFQVFLIPETRNVTVFGDIQPGVRVNLEVDSQTQAVVDTVERVMAARA
ncbi:MAG: riboflavin synthase subunit alpha [Litorivicinus sp.]